MLSKADRSSLNIEFWGLFKKHMRRHMSSNQRRINWLNYPTVIKHTYLRLHADSKSASIHFDIQFKDEGIRELFWHQLLELKSIINKNIKHPSIWNQHFHLEGTGYISRISWVLNDINYFEKTNWNEIHDFFENILCSFDLFYQEFKDVLINLIE